MVTMAPLRIQEHFATLGSRRLVRARTADRTIDAKPLAMTIQRGEPYARECGDSRVDKGDPLRPEPEERGTVTSLLGSFFLPFSRTERAIVPGNAECGRNGNDEPIRDAHGERGRSGMRGRVRQ
jgi:hypothetical protein